jgi:hypothetical protein
MRKTVICLTILILFTFSVYAEPRIDNQGNSNMCIVYAVCNAIEEQMIRDGKETPENGFSKQWLWDKCIETGSPEDEIYIATALNIAYERGLCPTGEYDTESADKSAEQYKIATYSAINFTQFKDNLVRNKVIVIMTTLSRDNWQDGIIMMDENPANERHGTYLIDFDEITVLNDRRDYYIGINSWGDKWGYGGKYYMDYRFAYMGILFSYVVKI